MTQSYATGRDYSLVSSVISAQQGCQQAHTALVTHFYPGVHRFLLVRAGDPDLAADLTQDTFLAAFERINQLREPGTFPAWLFQIARNTWRMWVRQRTTKQILSLEAIRHVSSFAHVFARRSMAIEQLPERDLVLHVFADLSPKLQEALYLRYIAGFSDDEMALILDITPAAAQKRAYRATVSFRKQYDELQAHAGKTAEHEELEPSETRLSTSPAAR